MQYKFCHTFSLTNLEYPMLRGQKNEAIAHYVLSIRLDSDLPFPSQLDLISLASSCLTCLNVPQAKQRKKFSVLQFSGKQIAEWAKSPYQTALDTVLSNNILIRREGSKQTSRLF